MNLINITYILVKQKQNRNYCKQKYVLLYQNRNETKMTYILYIITSNK